MKSKILLFAALALTLAACETNEPANKSEKLNIIYKGKSPYIDIYNNLGNDLLCVSYAYRYYQQNEILNEVYSNKAKDTTITLKNNVSVLLHDEYKLLTEGDFLTLQLTRTGSTLNGVSESYNVELTNTDYVHPAVPIELLTPEISPAQSLPTCSADNFLIRWNADSENKNGVAVIAEWKGVTIFNSSQDTHIANMDILPDTGEAVLNPDLFQNMPDDALVELSLYRGDFFAIDGTKAKGLLLKDAEKESPEAFMNLLRENTDLLIQMEPFTLGAAAVTSFSFFLGR